MARPLIPFVQNGYYASRNWIPLVKGNGFTTSGGGEQEEVWETASGSIVTFDAVPAPFRQLSVAVEPVQNLNGYDSPWPAGGGKNKEQFFAEYDRGSSYATGTPRTYNDGILSISGTVNAANVWFYMHDITSIMSALGTATISLNIISGSVTNLDFRINVEETGQATERYYFEKAAVTLTYNSAKTYKLVGFISVNATVGGSVSLTAGVQIESGSTDTSWAPYSNICPISGWDEVKVTRTGKNLLDLSAFAARAIARRSELSVNQDNTITITCTESGQVWAGTPQGVGGDLSNSYTIPVNGGETIVLSTSFAVRSFAVVEADAEKTVTSYNETAGPVTLREDTRFVAVRINVSDSMTVGDSVTGTFQVELGSTATAYEPYQGNQYTIQLGETVYGGTLDVVNGKMTVDRAMVDMGSMNWVYDAIVPRIYTTELNTSVKIPQNNNTPANCLSSMYENTSFDKLYASEKKNGTMAFGETGTFSVINTSYANAASFKTAMSGVQLVYELATPITIQLTPVQISSLQGVNNVWSDAGDVTVEYRAQ